MQSTSAWSVWYQFRKEAARSWLLRLRWLLRGVYVGEGARIPGGGLLDFGATVSLQRFAVLNARPGGVIRVGRGSRLGAFAVISAVRSIEIGTDVLIADRVFISDHHHAFADSSQPVIGQGASSAKPVTIGSGCWLGINVCVMPGVELGPHCIVGAGSVVTGSFPANSIIAGVPARLIRMRVPDGA